MISLRESEQILKLLADPTRMRLLNLLAEEELTVVELAEITRLAQPRVSTHLARLREVDLVRDRKAGVSSYYRVNQELDPTLKTLWHTLRNHTLDPLLEEDLERMPEILRQRADERNWVDAVAGDMERHYSPGRTWESSLRGVVHLLQLGRVLDIASGDGVLAELLAPHCERITCVDASEPVVAACRRRLKAFDNAVVKAGDMHELPFGDGLFDVAMLNHALTYSHAPEIAVREAARVLAPGGRLLINVLAAHQHSDVVGNFGHVNNGFDETALAEMVQQAGLAVLRNGITSQEKRPPHFRILTLLAEKPQ